METIPQKELRNNVGEVLRRAEAGEEFEITVSGRPVAQLGPLRKRRWVPAQVVNEILQSPADPEWWDDITQDPAEPLVDPWQRSHDRRKSDS